MSEANDFQIEKATPRPWSLEMPKGYITSRDGDLIAVVCDNIDTGCEAMGDEPSEHNSYLIQKAVNEYDGLISENAALKSQLQTKSSEIERLLELVDKTGAGFSAVMAELKVNVQALKEIDDDLKENMPEYERLDATNTAFSQPITQTLLA